MSILTKKFHCTEKFLKLINALEPLDKLVKVKSWKPYIGDGFVFWPVMLVDSPGKRVTVTPQWDRTRFLNIFKRFKE